MRCASDASCTIRTYSAAPTSDTGIVTIGSHTHGHADLSKATESEAESVRPSVDVFQVGPEKAGDDVAARHGDNIASRGENMPWYDGPTLLQVLETLEAPRHPAGAVVGHREVPHHLEVHGAARERDAHPALGLVTVAIAERRIERMVVEHSHRSG